MSKKYLTVTALTRYIKRKFELDQHLTTVWLKAEISNFKHHSRGHMYFTLKDDQSKISSVMFAGYNRSLRFKPENGMHVIVKGEVSVYEAMGQYQLYVHDMIPDGVGALHLAFEQLKEKLLTEGLFEESTKRSIPAFPEHIGVITSPTGAAIQDILSTINRRFPYVKVTVFPTLVQGEQAKEDLVKKIKQANQLTTLDSLILARGGGSIEDLWPFNEEIVARAVAESKLPVISGVGHETDTTIVDFVADLRAPTPTSAAELAVPLQSELQLQISQSRRVLSRELKQLLKRKREKLQQLQTNYAFQYPKQLLIEKEQELDRLVESLEKGTIELLRNKKHAIEQLYSQLKVNHPKHQITTYQQTTSHLIKTLQTRFEQVLDKKVSQFDRHLNKIQLLSPLNTMKRGYSISYNKSGELINSINQIETGQLLTVKVSDGTIISQISDVKEDEND